VKELERVQSEMTWELRASFRPGTITPQVRHHSLQNFSKIPIVSPLPTTYPANLFIPLDIPAFQGRFFTLSSFLFQTPPAGAWLSHL
jgi:hypothetical protein